MSLFAQLGGAGGVFAHCPRGFVLQGGVLWPFAPHKFPLFLRFGPVPLTWATQIACSPELQNLLCGIQRGAHLNLPKPHRRGLGILLLLWW